MTDEELLTKYLDGALTEDERREFHIRRNGSRALDALARNLAAQPDVAVPGNDFDTRVLRAVRVRQAASEERPRFHLRWALPSVAFASAVIAFALGVILSNVNHESRQAGAQFVFVHPQAQKVSLVGEFNGWNPDRHVMRRENGVWKLDVDLPPGVYQYQFVVDGHEWTSDPAAQGQVDDGFGRVNSIVHVAPTEL